MNSTNSLFLMHLSNWSVAVRIYQKLCIYIKFGAINEWPNGVKVRKNFQILNSNMSILNLESFMVIEIVIYF